MGEITAPSQVKLFVGMLSQDTSLFNELSKKFADIYGPPDMESPEWPWEHTTYYQEEMGAGLKRKFIFFEKLINPGDIAEIKLKTVELEKKYLNKNNPPLPPLVKGGFNGGRKINLDPGYLDSAKIVLVSTKDFSHRIYLDKGIYGEVTLIYSGKDYLTLPYTFPDFKTKKYMEVFKTAREIYKKQEK